MLPSSATHLLQPLDVVIFSSLKRSWRVILDEWKKEVSFDKKYFPSLLERLVNTQKQTMKKKNLQSVFRACGICPLDCNEPSEITNPRYFYQ